MAIKAIDTEGAPHREGDKGNVNLLVKGGKDVNLLITSDDDGNLLVTGYDGYEDRNMLVEYDGDDERNLLFC